MALPTTQWAHVRYAKFELREHVGFGAWQACSGAYEEQQLWASEPLPCDSLFVAECAGLTPCTVESDEPGANGAYEKSWLNCSARCSPAAWEAHCLAQDCS